MTLDYIAGDVSLSQYNVMCICNKESLSCFKTGDIFYVEWATIHWRRNSTSGCSNRLSCQLMQCVTLIHSTAMFVWFNTTGKFWNCLLLLCPSTQQSLLGSNTASTLLSAPWTILHAIINCKHRNTTMKYFCIVHNTSNIHVLNNDIILYCSTLQNDAPKDWFVCLKAAKAVFLFFEKLHFQR